MDQRIACIGGATLDRRVEPLGRLRAGTSNPVRSAVSTGGTARNIAEALARLGVSVTFCSRVGRDAAGDRLVGELTALGIDLAGLDRDDERPTASYTSVLDQDGELVMGLADMEILDALDREWIEARLELLAAHDLWIVDANLPRPVLERLAAKAPEGVRIFADPVSVEKSARLAPILDRFDTIFPDLAEATALAGFDSGDHSPGDLGTSLREQGTRRILISLGDSGVWVDDPPRREKLRAMRIENVASVNGAGDCFVAGFVYAETAGGDRESDPVVYGLAAASLSVESPRAVPADLTAVALTRRVGGAS